MQDSTKYNHKQAQLAKNADNLFDMAFNLGCEAEELRTAYVEKVAELRKAQKAHGQAVDLLTRYTYFLEK